MFLEEKDFETLATWVPGLLHLHLDPHETTVRIGRLPQLLPQLRTLKIRQQRVSDSDFLKLHQLQHLERLEILDARPEGRESSHLLDLISQLQALSDRRIHIITSKRQRDPLSDRCIENNCDIS